MTAESKRALNNALKVAHDIMTKYNPELLPETERPDFEPIFPAICNDVDFKDMLIAYAEKHHPNDHIYFINAIMPSYDHDKGWKILAKYRYKKPEHTLFGNMFRVLVNPDPRAIVELKNSHTIAVLLEHEPNYNE